MKKPVGHVLSLASYRNSDSAHGGVLAPVPWCLVASGKIRVSRQQQVAAAGINFRRGAGLCLFSSFLLHTYLVPSSPAQDSGGSVWKACIAHRGVALHSIVLRGHRGRNF